MQTNTHKKLSNKKHSKKCCQVVLVYDELQEKHLLYLKTRIKSPLSFSIYWSFYLTFHILTSLFIEGIIFTSQKMRENQEKEKEEKQKNAGVLALL